MPAERAPITACVRAWTRRDVMQCTGWLALLAGGGTRFASARAATGTAFEATRTSEVLTALGGAPIRSDAIELDLADLTENGAMVPVSVTSRLPRTEQIVLVADANPFPLVASFDVAPDTDPYISTRVKIAQTCTVHAIVRADGRLYATSKDTSVTIGGCGG